MRPGCGALLLATCMGVACHAAPAPARPVEAPPPPMAEVQPPDPSPETEPPPPVDIESCSIMKGFDEGCRGCMLVGCCNPPVAFEGTLMAGLGCRQGCNDKMTQRRAEGLAESEIVELRSTCGERCDTLFPLDADGTAVADRLAACMVSECADACLEPA